MTDFNGRTILVTGASGGIGEDSVRAALGDLDLSAIAPETGARMLPFDVTVR